MLITGLSVVIQALLPHQLWHFRNSLPPDLSSLALLVHKGLLFRIAMLIYRTQKERQKGTSRHPQLNGYTSLNSVDSKLNFLCFFVRLCTPTVAHAYLAPDTEWFQVLENEKCVLARPPAWNRLCFESTGPQDRWTSELKRRKKTERSSAHT